jgi:hypothetical protein
MRRRTCSSRVGSSSSSSSSWRSCCATQVRISASGASLRWQGYCKGAAAAAGIKTWCHQLQSYSILWRGSSGKELFSMATARLLACL